MVNGITTAGLGKPEYRMAIVQHEEYIEALRVCGLEVTVLPPDETYPDSTFVEDTALLLPECAIITNPGAPSRRGEIMSIEKVLSEFFQNIEHVCAPGTVDGGDILVVDDHYYIGLSERTNIEGARQINRMLNKYGKTASTIQVGDVLHLKSAAAYLGNRHMVMTSTFEHNPLFKDFLQIPICKEESYAANCIRINDRVIIPKGFTKSKFLIENSGFSVFEVDVSEFRKLDGGVSCLSLRI